MHGISPRGVTFLFCFKHADNAIHWIGQRGWRPADRSLDRVQSLFSFLTLSMILPQPYFADYVRTTVLADPLLFFLRQFERINETIDRYHAFDI
jgi:hypothetical protein